VLEEKGESKDDYVLTILQAIREMESSLPSIKVKLLLSIDRTKPLEDCIFSVDKALQH